jgi:hypothetical protein
LFSYFVWYRVNQADSDTETAIRGMIARLSCRSGVSGRLMKKRDEPRLWMETYTDVADPVRFEHLLRQAVDEYDVEMFIDGNRCTECFLADSAIDSVCG